MKDPTTDHDVARAANREPVCEVSHGSLFDVECCEHVHIHENVIREVGAKMPDENTLYDLAEWFKVFGDSTRIRILFLLFEAKELCVCDIAELLHMTQSAISHQLRILKQAQLIRNRRDGKQIFYALADDHVVSILSQGLEHLRE